MVRRRASFLPILPVLPLVALALLSEPAAAEERVLRHEVVVDAPPAEVWRMFVTEEGLRAWVAPFAKVDLRIGGTIETSYDPEASAGEPGNIVQRILAYEPEAMLAARTENAPAFPEGLAGVWGVTRFEALEGGRTRVVGTMLGWQDTPEADRARAFFDAANPTVYEALRARFAPKEATAGGRAEAEVEVETEDADETMDVLRRSIGIWVFEDATERGTFRAVNVVESGPNDRSVVARSWIGFDRLEPHGATLCWIDPLGGGVRFVNLDERAAVTEGGVHRADDEGVLAWDWRSVAADGTVVDYEVTTWLVAPDRHRMTLRVPGAALARSLEYRRVEALPESLRSLLDGAHETR